MEQHDNENPHKLKVSPRERRDRELTSWGWSVMVGLALSSRWLDLSEWTISVLIFLIIYTVNITRLVKGFRVHYLALAIGLISLVHSFFAFIEVEDPFPFWYTVGAAVLLYGIAKLLLKDKIR